MLRQGGNAVDAAVATGFALAVTYPRAGNIGGGGFMVIHSAERNEDIAIDYRETAPAATTRDMFLGADGKPDPQIARFRARHRRARHGRGLALALEKYGSGKFTLAQMIAPAIELARDGFVGRRRHRRHAAATRIAGWRAGRRPRRFFKPDGSALRDGDRLVQTDLAATLEAIAEQGRAASTKDPVAEKIVAAVSDAGGIMTPTI
jgi:gamma-glutamyltranspeptidase/glutathione hydrolase